MLFTLNSPPLNPVTLEMMQRLIEALEDLGRGQSVREEAIQPRLELTAARVRGSGLVS